MVNIALGRGRSGLIVLSQPKEQVELISFFSVYHLVLFFVYLSQICLVLCLSWLTWLGMSGGPWSCALRLVRFDFCLPFRCNMSVTSQIDRQIEIR